MSAVEQKRLIVVLLREWKARIVNHCRNCEITIRKDITLTVAGYCVIKAWILVTLCVLRRHKPYTFICICVPVSRQKTT